MFDVAIRHQQALDPSALTTIPATLDAIGRAIDDCRHAGLDAGSDPAVVLLARHLAEVCAGRPADAVLRRACTDRIAALERFPTLLALSIAGVAYNAAAKERFHIDGRKALRRLALALGIDPTACDIHSLPGGPAVSGEIVLHSAEVHLRLGIGGISEGRELLYRRPRSPSDRHEPRARYADMSDLLAADRLAVRIRRDLGFTEPADTPALLTA